MNLALVLGLSIPLTLVCLSLIFVVRVRRKQNHIESEDDDIGGSDYV